MNCNEAHELLDAYIDRELDLGNSLTLQKHLSGCENCRVTAEQRRGFQQALRANFPHFEAPDALADKIRAQVRSARTVAEDVPLRRRLLGNRFWALAAGLTILLISSGLLLRSIGRTPAAPALAEQVVASHIRSLMANHLMDVVSTDQHTVKPWFTGRLDFAPSVTDLSSRGFALVGGRLDYLESRPVAALVYKRRLHVINLFIWPTQDSDSEMRSSAIRGYNIVHEVRSHMEYWAVSDLNAAELKEFMRNIK